MNNRDVARLDSPLLETGTHLTDETRTQLVDAARLLVVNIRCDRAFVPFLVSAYFGKPPVSQPARASWICWPVIVLPLTSTW